MNKNFEKLVQEEFNYNIAFQIHLKEFNQNVRDELERRVSEVFFFSKGVDWKFDSFGIEKAGERKIDILGYFIFRAVEVDKIKKLFTDEFKDYPNAIKLSCSVAKYQKTDEEFFEIEL
ncbi:MULTISPECIES: hypothetical protein [Arcobacteraceae]|uniref:Uncharacterized protein n=2 Tax=Aliarcobacter thereius TaxID=544718 RepID=A0A1C0BAB2_9BACT|nr:MULTISPECIES: hypothetical protein [Arcobacteraceae]OCL85268.1 hypothetical protein AAX30_01951 [Arcobacter porcinus]OCL88344.1 hypothetical protein AAX26_00024 [Aliarcobacter thereius]OCL91834.1 hypothetical protein AAX25_00559 [Aliarcobacter thereius]OCL95068.1 hypothetical protein AA347_00514 [Aliarcobacter thereius LMG 24486]OCM00520.1 hypothetical protein AAX29_00524 [Aliarcobacter thereius]